MRGAGLCAGRNDGAIGDGLILFIGFDARPVDALHAVSAFFHDAAAADGHFRIAHELELRSFPVLEAQEVEAAHFIRTVIRAVARSDTALVDHVVKAFGAVHRGAHGTNLLAWSVLALLAGHGLEKGFRILEGRLIFGRIAGGLAGGRGCRVRIVAIDANPVHFASAHHLVLADNRNVVFRLAGDDAGVAAIAAIEVDGHGPFVALVRKFGLALVKGIVFRRRFLAFGKIRILAVFLESCRHHDVAAFHVEVILRAGHRVAVAGFPDHTSRSRRSPKRVRGAHDVSVEAFVCAGIARLFAPVAQGQNHNTLGLAREDPSGGGDLASRKSNVNDVRKDLPVFTAPRRDGVG